MRTRKVWNDTAPTDYQNFMTVLTQEEWKEWANIQATLKGYGHNVTAAEMQDTDVARRYRALLKRVWSYPKREREGMPL